MVKNSLETIITDLKLALADETGEIEYPDMMLRTSKYGMIHLTFFAFKEEDGTLFAAVGVGTASSEELKEKRKNAQKEDKHLIAVINQEGEGIGLRIDEIPHKDHPELFDYLTQMGAFV
jgi:hypothetical protein